MVVCKNDMKFLIFAQKISKQPKVCVNFQNSACWFTKISGGPGSDGKLFSVNRIASGVEPCSILH